MAAIADTANEKSNIKPHYILTKSKTTTKNQKKNRAKSVFYLKKEKKEEDAERVAYLICDRPGRIVDWVNRLSTHLFSPYTDFYLDVLLLLFEKKTTRRTYRQQIPSFTMRMCFLLSIFLSTDSYILMKCHGIIIQLWNWWYFLTMWYGTSSKTENRRYICFFLTVNWLLHTTIKMRHNTVKNLLTKGREKNAQTQNSGSKQKESLTI